VKTIEGETLKKGMEAQSKESVNVSVEFLARKQNLANKSAAFP
jgi:hypothetical protein